MSERHTLHIKNMVCPRCIMVVEDLLHDLGLTPLKVELGEAEVQEELTEEVYQRVKERLEKVGFCLLDDKKERLVEEIRRAVIERVHYDAAPQEENLSDYLVGKCHKDYSLLSKLFSEEQGISIEKYYLAQKIERVKELLTYDEMTISEIADSLHYSSVAHLSTQFRTLVGMTPSEFRRQQNPQLKPLDEV